MELWLAVLIGLVVFALGVVRVWIRRRYLRTTVGDGGPTSGRAWWLTVLALAFAFGSGILVSATDNFWWLLVALPAVGLALLAWRQHAESQTQRAPQNQD